MGSLVQKLIESGRLHLYAIMAASGAIPCLMFYVRAWHYDSVAYQFLFWNLILATIPFAISQWLALSPPRRDANLLLGLFFWLLFFPNAPYVVTDLMHLRDEPAVPQWFDLVLLLSLAWSGLMLGYLSLLEMHRLTEGRYGRVVGWIFVSGAIVLSSFGIYLGRYLRWNSWDIVTQPGGVLADVAERLLHPLTYPRAYGVTLAFSMFLMIGYLLLKSLVRLQLHNEPVSRR